VSPGYSIARSDRQWVDSYDDATATGTYGRRYVFADFSQRTFSTTVRLNWVFSPTLSLQVYAQTLFSSGEYQDFKALREAGTDGFLVYGEGASTAVFDRPVTPTVATLDADGVGPAPSYTIDHPNFNWASLRGNAVLRWQYSPGSTLYLVWTQSRWDTVQDTEFAFRRSFNRLALAPVENIFLLKLTYWWNT